MEAGLTPIELDYELNSIARFDFDGTLPCRFTAHPRLDPESGELHAICYWWPHRAGALRYVVVGADGRVRRGIGVAVPGMPMVHETALTGRYVVVLDGADFAGPPVARVFLPQRVPYGFHGDWVPDSLVGPPA